MPKHTFRKTEAGRYILQTGRCPAHCRDLLFVVWQGAIGNLQEEVVTARELNVNQPVAPDKVPIEWYNALAKASGVFLEREPPCPEPPCPEPPCPEPPCPEPPCPEPLPSMFGWGPYWVLFIIVIIFSFILGASS